MMILPATTTSLPNFFTPSRLLTLSRPFLTLPCPFLCAMRLSGFLRVVVLRLFRLRFAAQADAGDLDARQLAAMSDGAVVTFPPAILERDDFLVLALLDDFAGDGGAFVQRAAVGLFVAVAVKQDVGEEAFFSRLFVEEIDINDIALRDAMLS